MAFLLPSWNEITDFIRIQAEQIFLTDLLLWQWISLVLCIFLCINSKVVPSHWLTSIRRRFHGFAQNRRRAVLLCALFPMVARVALLPAVPVRPPSVHDEFSLLLLADTFSSGRLTNPTHAYWKHFETIHVIQKPTYASMYPPALGVFLAIGQIFHNPWLGVLLSVGLMCGAICWMLQAWVPPAWALGGGLITALQIGIASHWMNSYYGGIVPALGSALIVGAMPRFLRKPGWTSAGIFATSMVLLVNARPLEGTVLSALCVGLTAWWRWRAVFKAPQIRWRILAPAFTILLLGATFTFYHSWRVTGHPTKIPYVVNRETYGWPENLAILPPQRVTYRHEILKNMHLLELSHRGDYSTFHNMVYSWSYRVVMIWEFFVGPALTLPLLMLPWTLRNRKLRALFYIVIIMWALNLLQLMAYPQHVAPETAFFYLLLVTGIRLLYVVAKRMGMQPERVIATLVLALVCSAGFNLFSESLNFRMTFWEHPYVPHRDFRAAIVSKLELMPGKHLVFVHYMPFHSPHEEWVYNAANIDASKIVWANSMTSQEDAELRNYFHDRQAWIVEPDTDPTGLLPFSYKSHVRYGPFQ